MNLQTSKKFKVDLFLYVYMSLITVNISQTYAARWVDKHILAGGSQENNILLINTKTSKVSFLWMNNVCICTFRMDGWA